MSAILLAAMNDHTDVVFLLLAIGLSYLDTDQEGNNLLHIAASQGNLGLMKAIVKREITRHIQNQKDRRESRFLNTPLRDRYLKTKNRSGQTPLELARINGHKEIEDLLQGAVCCYQEDKKYSCSDCGGPRCRSSVPHSRKEDDDVEEDGSGSPRGAYQHRQECDLFDSVAYEFALTSSAKRELSRAGYSTQGYYSTLPAVVDDGDDSADAEVVSGEQLTLDS